MIRWSSPLLYRSMPPGRQWPPPGTYTAGVDVHRAVPATRELERGAIVVGVQVRQQNGRWPGLASEQRLRRAPDHACARATRPGGIDQRPRRARTNKVDVGAIDRQPVHALRDLLVPRGGRSAVVRQTSAASSRLSFGVGQRVKVIHTADDEVFGPVGQRHGGWQWGALCRGS